jgi:hypothetical protein
MYIYVYIYKISLTYSYPRKYSNHLVKKLIYGKFSYQRSCIGGLVRHFGQKPPKFEV